MTKYFWRTDLKVIISALRLSVRLGCTADERAYPQIVETDLAINLSSYKSADSDLLADTVDYMAIVQTVKKAATDREFALLETLAAEIGRAIVLKEALAESVSVSVTKQIVPECRGIAVALLIGPNGEVLSER